MEPHVDINSIVTQLKIAKEFYYKGKPIMTDPQFDELEQKLRNFDPDNDYFKLVGAPVVRGEKVKHTIPMGSLDQVSTQDEALAWMRKYPNEQYVFSDKLDGNSIALYYDESGHFERAVTRGDGIEGLDVTRHIRRMFNRPWGSPIPAYIEEEEYAPTVRVVRAEVIMKPELFAKHVTGYKNPRNYVAGQLNKSVADQAFIDYVEIIAFDSDIVDRSKSYVIQWLSQLGFSAVDYTEGDARSITMIGFENYLAKRKAESRYELDGIVIDINHSQTRRELGFDNLNPAFARKFKVNVNFVETEVVDVEWNPSKDGYLKPRVQFEPVDLAGVTISFATGFNAKFIQDNKIGPGAIIKVTRSGDVIPFIQEVIKPAVEGALPEDYEDTCNWSDTGVDLILKEKPDESYIKEITEFFTSIDAPVLKLGNVTALYEAGFTTIAQINKMSEDDMVVVLGENGFKAYAGLREKLNGIQDYVLAGSLPFFGRGVGKRKMKVLAENHGNLALLTYDDIVNTPGFDDLTAVKIANAIPFYVDFIDDLVDYVSREIYSRIEGKLNGIVVCFTGVRSKELEDVIESNGGKVSSSVSKDLTHLVAKDPNGKSGKLDKARKNGVKVISLEEAKELWIG